MCTRRVLSRMTNKTKYRTRPRYVTTSTLKKSAAAIASQWTARNVFQSTVRPRVGAGSKPFSLRMRAIVERPSLNPTFFSAPRSRV